MVAVVLDHGQTLLEANLDHVGVEVDTDHLMACLTEEFEHLAPTAPDVQDATRKPDRREQGQVTFLCFAHLSAPEALLEGDIVNVSSGCRSRAKAGEDSSDFLAKDVEVLLAGSASEVLIHRSDEMLVLCAESVYPFER